MERNRLVLFYSWSGNTRRVAQMIAKRAGADLEERRPVEPYPRDYGMMVRRARTVEKAYPALHPLAVDWRRYGTVFLGAPNWCGTMASPLAAFLYQTMPVDKSIIPFCTHGGGGAGSMAADVAHYCIGCDILPLLALWGNGGAGAEQQIAQWLLRVERILEMLRQEQGTGGALCEL